MSSATLSPPVSSPAEGGLWRVSRSCAVGGQSAEGVVLYVAAGAEPRHEGLAGARACQRLGAARLAEGSYAEAADAARTGLEALGRGYAPPGTKDDTKLKIYAAEDRIRQGALQDGATNLLRTLEARIGLYEQRYAGELRT